MSTIFGIINKNGEPVATKAMTMQQALMQRAKDGKGTWLKDSVFLGHLQLNVLYRQLNESLPLEDDEYVITADGRIDNHRDLAYRLGIEKDHPSVSTDGALILTAYKKWGNHCVDHLEGEFAFCIWNKKEKKLFCATDHIGFRPLYYYDTPKVFVFCSEMKGILAIKDTPDFFNEEVLIEYFFRQSDHTKTYNDEIYSLCGANKLMMTNGKINIQKYWEPQQTGRYHFKKDTDWAECLRHLLFETVENHIQTDLPVGIGLSGGLDSSSIACIAAKILEKRNKPLYAFSSVLPTDYKGIEVDERKYISMVGKHLKNLEHIYIEAPNNGLFNNLETAFEIEETLPNAFFYMDHAIFSAAANKNIGVFLSGMGGDFLVSYQGNETVYQLARDFKWMSAAILVTQFSKNEKRTSLSIIKRELIKKTPAYKYYSEFKNRGNLNWQNETTLAEDFVNTFQHKLQISEKQSQQALMKEYIISGSMARLVGSITHNNNVFQMAAAIPLVDKRIIDFMIEVPLKQFVAGGFKRSLLRHAMEGILPSEIQWRKDKMPYSPDYISRVIKEKVFIQKILTSEEYDHTFKYINKHKIIKHLDQIKPIAGMINSREIAAIRIMQGIITCIFLRWLKDKNYNL